EPASPLRDVSQSEACPTVSRLDAKQDRANIAKSSTLPHESTSRVTSLTADEGSMQHKLDELTALCTSLQRQHSEMVARFEAQGLEIKSLKARIKVLEDKDRGVAEQSGDDAPIKGRRLDVGEEAAERVSDDTEEMATVLTSMDAATVLASRVAEVPTGSDEVIKSSVEILVPILSESEGISDDTCDVPFCDNSPPLDVLNDHFEIFSDLNDDCTSSDDDSFEDIDYVEASPPDSKLVSLEEVKDDILHEKLLNINILIAKIESLNDDPTPDCVL
nr:hypothetical protein [Tanacetum cinerariifolium]